jgi:hypothetical protein
MGALSTEPLSTRSQVGRHLTLLANALGFLSGSWTGSANTCGQRTLRCRAQKLRALWSRQGGGGCPGRCHVLTHVHSHVLTPLSALRSLAGLPAGCAQCGGRVGGPNPQPPPRTSPSVRATIPDRSQPLNPGSRVGDSGGRRLDATLPRGRATA